MKNQIENQNEEALLDAFKIEELEERLEMAPWTDRDKEECGNVPGA